ncbi:MAG: DNA adenine methylase [Candidatus Neomarinimicrobiota bacterium]
MTAQAFEYPSTRYSGSKRRFIKWIWSNIEDLKFESALDVFGGTGSISLLFKKHNKKVYYNDILKFNRIIGTALVENKDTIVTSNDLNSALAFRDKDYPNFIQNEFKDIFYNSSENIWLDKAITNFSRVQNKYKRAILISALFQACLAKRPFNLFHRANLYIRTNEVERSFGNKPTWERSFEDSVRRYVNEYNLAVFNNGKNNKVIGGFDAQQCPNGVDLVYLDPPYFSKSSYRGTNYLTFYHFLEGLADYPNWAAKIKNPRGKIKKMQDYSSITRWTHKREIHNSFNNLIKRFQDNIIVLSYQSDGVPSKEEIGTLLRNYKRKVSVFSKPHQYVLSKQQKEELLFVAL